MPLILLYLEKKKITIIKKLLKVKILMIRYLINIKIYYHIEILKVYQTKIIINSYWNYQKKKNINKETVIKFKTSNNFYKREKDLLRKQRTHSEDKSKKNITYINNNIDMFNFNFSNNKNNRNYNYPSFNKENPEYHKQNKINFKIDEENKSKVKENKIAKKDFYAERRKMELQNKYYSTMQNFFRAKKKNLLNIIII